MTWSDVDWAATEAVVGRIQDRIFRAAKIKRPRLEPDDEQSSCPVLRGLGSGNEARLPDVYAGRVQEAHGTGATATPRRLRPRADWITVASIPALVSQEQFDRVQDKLAQNRQFARRNNTAHPYLLRALVSCGVCGLSCWGRCLPSGYRYDCCRGKLSAVHSHRATTRPSRYSPAEQVDALVWADLCRLLNEPEAIRFALERAHGGHWLPQDLQARRQALWRGQASVQQQMERLTEAYLASIVSLEEYRRRRLDLEQKAQSLAAQVQQLEGQVDRQGEVARVGLSMEEFCRRVREGLDQATWEQKRQRIEWLVVRVIVTDGEVEIRYGIPTSPAREGTRFCELRADFERLSARLKEWRAIATRYDTAPNPFMGVLCLPAPLAWPKP